MILIILLSSSFALSKSLSNDQIANTVADHFVKIQRPTSTSNIFEHWVYNTAGLTAVQCWRDLMKSPIPVRLQTTFTSGGVYRGPKNVKKSCESIAVKGFKPFCHSSNVWIKDVPRKSDLPLDYVIVDSKKPLIVEGLLKCVLNFDQLDIEHYAEPLSAEWLEVPSMKTFNLSGKKLMLKAGTLMIKSQYAPDIRGMPYSEPKTAVIFDQ